jgi:SPP1 gp7 family putative phage head morphogenesis protein
MQFPGFAHEGSTVVPKATGGKVLTPVRPNVGIEIAYQKALDSLIKEMHESLLYWLQAGYKADEPEAVAMAQDKTPAEELNRRMKRLARRWQKRFDQLAPDLAKHFAQAATERSDASLRAALKRGGMTVKFTLTPAANDALQAVVAENVGLIKSIASEHLTDVQGILMRSAARGRDLGGMTQELEARYGVTRRRAATIARDQNNKATAVIQRVRQRELGIKTCVWLHSTAGKHPRESHVAANGKRYKVEEGMLIDGEYIFPGEAINCRCTCRAVIPGLS